MEGDTARQSYEEAPRPYETPALTQQRVGQQAQQRVQYGRVKAEDLSRRGIAYDITSRGDAREVTDSTGSPLTNADKAGKIAYNTSGRPVDYSQRDVTGKPVVRDAYEGIPEQTDPKTGDIYKVRDRLPWLWTGEDPRVKAQIQEKAVQKINSRTYTALAGEETDLNAQARSDAKAAKNSAKSTLGAMAAEMPGEQFDLNADEPTLRAQVETAYNQEYGSKRANEKPWFGGGKLSPSAEAYRREIDARKAQTLSNLDQHLTVQKQAQASATSLQTIQEQRRGLRTDRLADINEERANAGLPAVGLQATDQPAQSPSTSQFSEQPSPAQEAQPPVQSQTAPLDQEPSVDQSALASGSDSSEQPDAPQGTTPEQTVALGNLEEAKNGNRWYKYDEENGVQFEPGSMSDALEQGVKDGVIDPQWADEHREGFKKAQEQYLALQEAAGGAQTAKALLRGAGVGGAFLAGAGPGAELGGAIGGFAGPIGAGIGSVIGGLAAGTLASFAAKKGLDKLGEYSDTIKSLNASAELHPVASGAGELLAFGASAPKAISKLLQLGEVAGGGLAAAKAIGVQLSKGAAGGLAFEAAARPAFDAARYVVADQLGIPHDQFQAPDAKSLLTNMALGVLLAGHSVEFKDYSAGDVANILIRAKMRRDNGIAPDAAMDVPATVEAFKKLGVDLKSDSAEAMSRPLTAQEQSMFDAMANKTKEMEAAGVKGVSFEGGRQALVPSLKAEGRQPISSAVVTERPPTESEPTQQLPPNESTPAPEPTAPAPSMEVPQQPVSGNPEAAPAETPVAVAPDIELSARQKELSAMDQRDPMRPLIEGRIRELQAQITEQPSATGFKTSRGSSYTMQNGKTVRNKVEHAGEEDSGSGIQPESEKTVFLPRQNARSLWDFMQGGKTQYTGLTKRVVLRDGKAEGVLIDKDGKEVAVPVSLPYSEKPAVGLRPYEQFNGGYGAGKEGSASHLGTEITELTEGQQAAPQAQPSEQPVVQESSQSSEVSSPQSNQTDQPLPAGSEASNAIEQPPIQPEASRSELPPPSPAAANIEGAARPAGNQAETGAPSSEEQQPARKGRSSSPETIAPAPATQPRIVGPALVQNGTVLAQGKIGDTHGQLKVAAAKQGIDATDAEHAFVDDQGRILNREQAAQVAEAAGQRRAGKGPLHSQHLSSVTEPAPVESRPQPEPVAAQERQPADAAPVSGTRAGGAKTSKRERDKAVSDWADINKPELVADIFKANSEGRYDDALAIGKKIGEAYDSAKAAPSAPAKTPEEKRGSTQVTLSDKDARPLRDFANSIPDSELYHGEEGSDSYGPEYGRELESHVTALYGLVKGGDTPKAVAAAVKNAGIGSVKLKLGKITAFENEGSPYDVLKVDIDSPDLHKLNAALKKLPFKSDYPDYHPHLTIAYLKKGEAKKYVGDDRFEGKEITIDALTHSSAERSKTNIQLSEPPSATAKAPEPAQPNSEMNVSAPVSASAREVLSKSARVKLTVPKGARFLRVTDSKGRQIIEGIENVTKGANVFHRAGPFKKIEAGTMGSKKEFIPLKGELIATDANTPEPEPAPESANLERVVKLAKAAIASRRGELDALEHPAQFDIGDTQGNSGIEVNQQTGRITIDPEKYASAVEAAARISPNPNKGNARLEFIRNSIGEEIEHLKTLAFERAEPQNRTRIEALNENEPEIADSLSKSYNGWKDLNRQQKGHEIFRAILQARNDPDAPRPTTESTYRLIADFIAWLKKHVAQLKGDTLKMVRELEAMLERLKKAKQNETDVRETAEVAREEKREAAPSNDAETNSGGREVLSREDEGNGEVVRPIAAASTEDARRLKVLALISSKRALRPEEQNEYDRLKSADDRGRGNEAVPEGTPGEKGIEDGDLRERLGPNDVQHSQVVQPMGDAADSSGNASREGNLSRAILRITEKTKEVVARFGTKVESVESPARTDASPRAIQRRAFFDPKQNTIFYDKELLDGASGVGELESLFGEEIIHAAQNHVGKLESAKAGKTLDAFMIEKYQDIAKDLGKTKKGMEVMKSSLLAYNTGPGKPPQELSADLAARYMATNYDTGMELERQLIQLRDKGLLTEESMRTAAQKLTAWFTKVLSVLKDAAKNTKEASPVLDESIRSVEAALRGEQSPLAAAKPDPEEAFYSQLSRTVDALPQETMTIGQAKAAITKGAKPDEIKLSGILTDPLSPIASKQPGDKVTKSELQDYAVEKQAHVSDVTLGEPVKKFEARKNPAGSWNVRDAATGDFSSYPMSQEEAEREALIRNKTGIDDDTHFSQYQLPGSEPGSYREQFVTWPNDAEGQQAKETEVRELYKALSQLVREDDNGGHDSAREAIERELQPNQIGNDYSPETLATAEKYRAALKDLRQSRGWRDGHAQYDSIANPVVRIRRNIRTDANGRRTYFIEEMQGPSKDEQAKMPEAVRKRIYEIGMKRALRDASAEGVDALGWTSGATQADRYSLENQIEKVMAYNRGDGTFDFMVTPKGERGHKDIDAVPTSKLEDTVGKELASKIAEQPEKGWHTYEGLDLKVGGQGLRNLYDVTLPRIASKLAEKVGGKVETTRMKIGEEGSYGGDTSLPDFERKLKEIRSAWDGPNRTPEGWRAWNVTLDRQAKDVLEAMKKGATYGEAMHDHGSEGLANHFGGEYAINDKFGDVHSMTIPPEWKASAPQFPLFAASPTSLPNKIDSVLDRVVKGGRWFWEGTADTLERAGYSDLAKQVKQQFDTEHREYGATWKPLREALGDDKAKQKIAKTEWEQYFKDRENGRAEKADADLKGFSTEGKKLVEAWKEVAVDTGKTMTKLGVEVKDGEKWRPIGNLGEKFFPRKLNQKTMEVLQAPEKHPKEWAQLVQDLIDNGNIKDASEADKFLKQYVWHEDSTNDYYANIEQARKAKLPESWLDYKFDEIAPWYVTHFARRVGQIEAYGQEHKDGDLFDKTLATIPKRKDYQFTQEYIKAAKDAAYFRNDNTSLANAFRNLQQFATGAFLSNPMSAIRNVVSGVSQVGVQYGPVNTLKAAWDTLMDLKGKVDQSKDMGILKDDLAQMMMETREIQENKVQRGVRKAVNIGLTATGFNLAENFARATAMTAAKTFARKSAEEMNKSWDSSASKQAQAFFIRHGIDPTKIAAEKGTGPETNRFTRASVRESQGGYNFDQVPLYQTMPVIKFVTQFAKWGTMMARFLVKHAINPAVFGTDIGGGKKVRTLKPLLLAAAFAIGGGELLYYIKELLTGKGRPDASLAETQNALDQDQKEGISQIGSRLFSDVIQAGTLGIFSDYAGNLREFATRGRFKNPFDPPGVQAFKNIFSVLATLKQQGQLTGKDIWDTVKNQFPGAKFADDVTDRVTGDALKKAVNTQSQARQAGMRMAKELDLPVQAPFSAALPVKTPKTPLYNTIGDALLTGDVAAARKTWGDYLKTLKTPAERDKAQASLKASVTQHQPIKVGGISSADNVSKFARWASTRLPPEQFRDIMALQGRYWATAARAGLVQSAPVAKPPALKPASSPASKNRAFVFK